MANAPILFKVRVHEVFNDSEIRIQKVYKIVTGSSRSKTLSGWEINDKVETQIVLMGCSLFLSTFF